MILDLFRTAVREQVLISRDSPGLTCLLLGPWVLLCSKLSSAHNLSIVGAGTSTNRQLPLRLGESEGLFTKLILSSRGHDQHAARRNRPSLPTSSWIFILKPQMAF